MNAAVQMQGRLKELERERLAEERATQEARKNDKFTQCSPSGWSRIRSLFEDKSARSAVPLYTLLAEHIDPGCGAVLCDQAFLAEHLGVTTRTIRRQLSVLEEKGALVRIPVAGRVCAYALNPHEVWKGYKTSKPNAAFVTKTLVNHDGKIQRRLQVMMSEIDGTDEALQQDLEL